VPGISVSVFDQADGKFTTLSASYAGASAVLIGEPIVCCIARMLSFIPL
jgi:hypothetical protein